MNKYARWIFDYTPLYFKSYFFQAYCPSHAGRSEPSFGRRRRDVNESLLISNDTAEARIDNSNDSKPGSSKNEDGGVVYKVAYEEAEVDKYLKDEVETPSHVRKMIEVINVAFILLWHSTI